LLSSLQGAEPGAAWARVIATLRFARIVHAAVKLGIADAIATEAKGAADVARETGTCEGAVYRLLRGLCAAGVVEEPEAGRFLLTPFGGPLARGRRPTFAATLLDFFDPRLVPLGGLCSTVQTGTPAFEERHGAPFYESLAGAPDGGAKLDASMSSGAPLRARALAGAVDLSGARVVVDVGGGEGVLAASLLEAYPHLQAMLLELPGTAARARVNLSSRGLAERCEVIAGDFFEGVPAGGDVYILSLILNDWEDARCVRVLTRCRQAMAPGAALYLIERLRGERAAVGEYFNLRTLELLRGHERSEGEMRALLEAAGLRIDRVIPTALPFSVVRAHTA
jgi:predicted O-methyltransferase YrrM